MKKLSHRENFIKVLRRQGIDFAPVKFDLCPSQEAEFKRRYGDIDYQDYFEFSDRWIYNSLLKQDFSDWQKKYFIGLELPSGCADCYGVARVTAKESGHIAQLFHPMDNFSTLKEFENYPYPVFDNSQIITVKRISDELHRRGLASSAFMPCAIWEYGWYMRGMENLMMDMACEDPCAEYHLERLMEIGIQRARGYATAGVDHIYMADDLGMQQAAMMSVELYCQYLKPRLARVIAAAKDVNSKVIVSYHSCGYIEPFIPHLIEAGIDVLNPVQPESMDFAKIHAEYGDRLSFWGTIGTQTTLPFGTPEEVGRVTLRNLEIAGNHGGLLCAPTHVVESDVPFENILAYVNACREFKK